MDNNSITLYEFGNDIGYNKEHFKELEEHLIKIWQSRKEEESDTEEEKEDLTIGENEEEVKKPKFQPFLNFHHSGLIRARNWVGFIQDKEQLIEIYPKVFKKTEKETETEKKGNMLQHIFFWMDYCTKWKFPHTQAGLDIKDIESFPELIIYLMASEIKTIVEEKPLSLYQEVEERMQMPRGRLNFQRYITNSLSKGLWHQMECDHEPFVFDNVVNRVIKYCVRLLAQQSGNEVNQNLLSDIIFVLDEVEDVPCTIYDLQKIKLNPFFEEYQQVLDYCRMILEQQIYSNESYSMQRWTILFPMELLFEDFIAGFIKRHFQNDWEEIKSQKSNMNVVNEPEPAFQMKHDIYLESKDRSRTIIIDTKYKVRTNEERNEKKRGVSQADLYQMLAYAYKRDCKEVILMYPCEMSEVESEEKPFKIYVGNEIKGDPILIRVVAVPFWSNVPLFNLKNLEDKPNILEKKLKEKLKNILDKKQKENDESSKAN